MNDYNEIIPEEAAVLRDIEAIIGIPIPIVEDLKKRETPWGHGTINDRGFMLGRGRWGEGRWVRDRWNYAKNRDPDGTKGKKDKKDIPWGAVIDENHVTWLLLNGSVMQNKLTNLPESIENLTSLQYLGIINNSQLKSLPQSFGNLFSLKECYLRSCGLHTIPETIGNLKSLTILALDDNPIAKLPESIGKVSSLKELHLDSLSSSIDANRGWGILNLPDLPLNLEHLNLRNNKLVSLPESIGNLTSLKTLSLGYNKLESLPESLGNLISLEFLFVEENNLTSIPESLGDLNSLTGVNLRENPLKEIPKSILKLKSLGWITGEPVKPQETTIRQSIMKELKQTLPTHKNGDYLDTPNENVVEARTLEKKLRKKELKAVEMVLKKSSQVKFLVNISELEEIKKYAKIFRQTQSEFIRGAIRETIRKEKTRGEEATLLPINHLRIEELKKIRVALERLEKKS